MIDLTRLTAAEKEELYIQLAYERRGSADLTPDDQQLWDQLHEAMDTRGRQPLARFLEGFGKARYREGAEVIRSFVEESCAPGTQRPAIMAVTVLVLRCLAAHLKQRSIPCTPTVMLNSLMVLPYAVEQRFPGYSPARLLDRVALRAS